MAFIAAAFGLIVGSLANVVILRQNTGERIIGGRSRCFACGKQLSWHELIPLGSFLIQKGRCRRCGSKISWQYPLVEVVLGLIYFFLFLRWENIYGSIAELPILGWWYLSAFLLLVLAIYDIRHHILPDKFSYAFIIVSLLGSIFFVGTTFFLSAVSLLPALFLSLLWLLSRGRWMGLGDAKLMAGGGFFLVWPGSLLALLFAFWLAAIYGLLLIFFRPSTTIKSEIPFGPFLALGILGVLLFPNISDLIFNVNWPPT